MPCRHAGRNQIKQSYSTRESAKRRQDHSNYMNLTVSDELWGAANPDGLNQREGG